MAVLLNILHIFNSFFVPKKMLQNVQDTSTHHLSNETEDKRFVAVENICTLNTDTIESELLAEFDRAVQVF
jgi:transcriptional regulator of NAD metabolism